LNILVIDGMGGGIGKSIIEHIKSEIPNAIVTAVGTNSIATSAMLKAGANNGATGENAVIFNCAKADFIIGVTGIIFANAMHGEISPAMAAAVSSSSAHKILLLPYAMKVFRVSEGRKTNSNLRTGRELSTQRALAAGSSIIFLRSFYGHYRFN